MQTNSIGCDDLILTSGTWISVNVFRLIHRQDFRYWSTSLLLSRPKCPKSSWATFATSVVKLFGYNKLEYMVIFWLYSAIETPGFMTNLLKSQSKILPIQVTWETSGFLKMVTTRTKKISNRSCDCIHLQFRGTMSSYSFLGSQNSEGFRTKVWGSTWV
jgi:hypothetical protein